MKIYIQNKNYLIYLNIFYIIIWFILITSINAQKVYNEDKDSICTHLHVDKLLKYVDLHLLENSIEDILQTNSFPMNDRTRLDSSLSFPNPCPFREKILQKMSKNETINITVIGGSNTYGTGIKEDERYKLRWSTLLSNYLNSGWYSGNFNVINIAKSGWSIQIWNERMDEIAKTSPDLLITDFTVNDTDEMRYRSLQTLYNIFLKVIETLEYKPALLMDLTLRIDKHSKPPDPSNKYDFNVKFKEKNTGLYGYYYLWKTADFSSEVTRKYEVPTASYRDVIYPDFFSPPDNILELWSDPMHVNSTTHKYMADHMYNSIIKMIKESLLTNKCQKTIKGVENPYPYCNRSGYIDPKYFEKAIRPVCIPRGIIKNMEATREKESKNTFKMSSTFNESSKWKFYSDSKSKYGWIYNEISPNNTNYLDESLKNFKKNLKISDLPQDKILSFEVYTNNTIQLSFLNSYPDIYGGFIIWFDDDLSISGYQNTQWITKSSVTSIYNIFFKEIDIDRRLVPQRQNFFNIKEGIHIMNIFPVPAKLDSPHQLKVKILGVLSC